ncbi:MAG: GTP-binding protein [Actinomycetia bacterium]|nr:GTP-binding protein [Actinomycetes bacterium]MCH9702860.1 GTP-binding protein [Actinomycetes bacterium]MCH9762056.1 GTP-binding protein [Actinomycetes bacterium]
MRTPVVVVAGQNDSHDIGEVLLASVGTALVEHRFDGHVVHRRTTMLQGGSAVAEDAVLELAHGCLSCTVRYDLLEHLRRLSRHPDVDRIAVRLGPWMEPEPVCFAIVRSPAAREVSVSAVVTHVDTQRWLNQAIGEDELDDGRTTAQVVVGQVEFADVLVLTSPDPDTLEVCRRLAPRARITVGTDRLDLALAHLESDARRGRSDHPHGPLLAGQPPLGGNGSVRLLEFQARRPFHPRRLHDAVDLLMDGVIRSKGRLWLASQPERVMWLESAGGGMRVSQAGKWLASMTSSEIAYVSPERRAIADLIWDHRHGDRHTSMTVLVCGADPGEILDALRAALLTDHEMNHPDEWPRYEDPFGDWHVDPCDEGARTGQTGIGSRHGGVSED